MASGDTLTVRALNRATLARQHLLARTDARVLDVVEHLVGLQAQAPLPPYFGLWSRIEGFTPDDLAERLLDRGVVRIAVMRSTVHLVSARDCLPVRAVVQPSLERQLRGASPYRPGLSGVDVEAVAAAAREIVDDEPRTAKQLGVELAKRWPDWDPEAMAFAARALLPLVQVPPRGVWGRSGQPTLTTAQAWLGDDGARTLTVADVLTRYLGAFGPASAADMQTWSGLTGLRAVVEEMRPRLRVFRDGSGRELFDLPDAPRPDADTPAPVRLVAEFDNLLLSHAERTRVISDEHRARLFGTRNAVFPGTVLVDGFVAGTWRLERKRGTATVTLTPYRRWRKRDAAAVEREACRLLAFAAPDAEVTDVLTGHAVP
ncbi:MAG: AlkZ family DNA glycosylase [Acidothermales bacterium]|nr:AlkZ family DNA glycosylase [Acidothermales bacterium]